MAALLPGVKSKLGAGATLIALAVVSFVASYLDLGHASLVLALIIAAIKAVLVGIVFMEIGRERASFKLALLAAAFLIVSLLSLVSADVDERGTPPLPPPTQTS